MTQTQERRAEGQGRLPVETLVEVVGSEPGIPAFEAESVDVSSRGMHLRTAYLPDAGAPLVCRFEDSGREIVVEGVVAWRREGARGGEFGVEFTALDARSVDALRELCDGRDSARPSEKAAAPSEPPHDSGTKVRLHIDGLGSPMKARVRSGDPQRVQVGSNLEFLKVGRRLEIEDLERGGRRSAHIDSVNVAIDPESQVPQLVVALRYEGAEESTPEPSVADLSGEQRPRTLRIPAEGVSVESGSAAAAQDDQIEDQGDREVEALRGKLGVAATHAGEAAVSAGKRMAELSGSAATNFSDWLKSASAKMVELSKRNKPPQRRTTAPAPTGPVSIEGQRLRPQSPDKQTAPASRKPSSVAAVQGAWYSMPKKKKVMASAGVAVVLATIVALATHRGSPPPGAEASGASAEPTTVGAAAPAATPAAAPAPAALMEQNGIVSADVPLFGATPMATMEPAPLAPPPSAEAASIEAAERADAQASVSEAASDESFPEEEGKAGKGKSSKPEDVAPWGRGKVTTPVIHRLRLDRPGDALQGSLQPTGFTVVIPQRKVMEQAGGISKRDPRIARVRTVNTPNGAQITFQFKDGVPAYRARLRRDYIEFLIGAPEPAKAAAPSRVKLATKTKK
ncbi:MAG TPA: PilZ domain-containing protein [Polyangiaceae bacterium]|nr:PilZ domain-containing protein [Polyangiaceae bacterium]